MDVFAIRLANLKRLTEQLQKGGRLKKDVATDLDIGSSYLSQLLGGKRMGGDVARKIEISAGLPHGSLDQLLNPTEPFPIGEGRNVGGSHDLRVDAATIAQAIKLVRLAFTILDSSHDNEADGVPVALAYEFLASRAEREVTPDNLVEFSRKLASRREREREERENGSAGGVGAGDRRAG